VPNNLLIPQYEILNIELMMVFVSFSFILSLKVDTIVKKNDVRQ